jgi:hypothetical protein
MVMVKDALDWLGLGVKDRVTGFAGMVTSVSFDLYGCVQVLISPPCKKDGTRPDSGWYDVCRLRRESGRVMKVPTFDFGKGPEIKPVPNRQ